MLNIQEQHGFTIKHLFVNGYILNCNIDGIIILKHNEPFQKNYKRAILLNYWW